MTLEEKFDREVAPILQRAVEEAERWNHHALKTEHLLLGLIGYKEPQATTVVRIKANIPQLIFYKIS